MFPDPLNWYLHCLILADCIQSQTIDSDLRNLTPLCTLFARDLENKANLFFIFSRHTLLCISIQTEQEGFQMQMNWTSISYWGAVRQHFQNLLGVGSPPLPLVCSDFWELCLLDPEWDDRSDDTSPLCFEPLPSLLIPNYQQMKRQTSWALYIFSNGLEIVEIKYILFAHEIWEIQARLIFLSIRQSIHKAVWNSLNPKLLCATS